MITRFSEYEDMWTKARQDVSDLRLPNVLPGLAGDWWQTYVKDKHDATGLKDPSRLRPIELLWCYWHEVGGLNEAIIQICSRYAGELRGKAGRSALARFDVSPLHSVSDLLSGLIQDFRGRGITAPRERSLEYLHQYGLTTISSPEVGRVSADPRSRFLGTYHSLLNTAAQFYKQYDDRFVNEDARPVLNALRQLHLILAEGAHNRFAALTEQVRVEMMVFQRILAKDEFRQFLGGRLLLPLPEPWMDRLESLRTTLQWGDVSITEFNNLANTGEGILLTVRYGPFNPRAIEPEPARDWALALRDEIMQYIHSYKAVTGEDLSNPVMAGQAVDATPPGVYLNARELRLRRRSGY
jgi:hypothetical protein